MEIVELTEEEAINMKPLGRPRFSVVQLEGFPDYSERVRRTAEALAPQDAVGFVIGEEKNPLLKNELAGIPTQVEVKVDIYARKHKTETWYAHPVQYFQR